MSKLFFIGTILISLVFSCQSNKNFSTDKTQKLTSDTIRIANEEIEYEVIIIDGGFTTWFNTFAKPRAFYTQEFLESRNRFWIIEWNNRFRDPRLNSLYDMPINYESTINYGFEVNYMLYNYLVYFQMTNKQQLGGFPARI